MSTSPTANSGSKPLANSWHWWRLIIIIKAEWRGALTDGRSTKKNVHGDRTSCCNRGLFYRLRKQFVTFKKTCLTCYLSDWTLIKDKTHNSIKSPLAPLKGWKSLNATAYNHILEKPSVLCGKDWNHVHTVVMVEFPWPPATCHRLWRWWLTFSIQFF